LKMGVTYWDTADSYGGGKNEKAIGKYFAKFPNDRKRVFLVTKAATSNPVWGSEGCPRWVRFPCTSATASNKTPVYIPGVFLAKPYSLTSFTQFWFDRK